MPVVPVGVVRVLVRKRDELEREVEQAEEALAARRRDLEHVAATIDLLLGQAAPQHTTAPRGRRSSGMTRIVLGVLRDEDRPLALDEIVDRYLQRSARPLPSPSERRALAAAVRRCLGKLRDRGVVVTVGPARAYRWAVSAPRPAAGGEPAASRRGSPGRTLSSAEGEE